MSYLPMIAVLLVPALLAFAALKQMVEEQPTPARARHPASLRRD